MGFMGEKWDCRSRAQRRDRAHLSAAWNQMPTARTQHRGLPARISGSGGAAFSPGSRAGFYMP